jgi:predicted DNA-binding transcriptional regulator AlpA
MDTHVPATPEICTGLMSAKQIVKVVGISRAHLHSLVRAKKFPPAALREGPRYTRWLSRDVKTWLADPQAYIVANATPEVPRA